MAKDSTLSVVVIGYNVDAYLHDCLASLARQTVDAEIEVVIVDDGSTDNTGEIAEAAAAGRPGWQVVHTDNGGPGRARNIGLERVTGRWLTSSTATTCFRDAGTSDSCPARPAPVPTW